MLSTALRDRKKLDRSTITTTRSHSVYGTEQVMLHSATTAIVAVPLLRHCLSAHIRIIYILTTYWRSLIDQKAGKDINLRNELIYHKWISSWRSSVMSCHSCAVMLIVRHISILQSSFVRASRGVSVPFLFEVISICLMYSYRKSINID